MSQTIPTARETKPGGGSKNPPGPRSFSPLGSSASATGYTLIFVIFLVLLGKRFRLASSAI